MKYFDLQLLKDKKGKKSGLPSGKGTPSCGSAPTDSGLCKSPIKHSTITKSFRNILQRCLTLNKLK